MERQIDTTKLVTGTGSVIGFITGALVGSIVTYLLTKKKIQAQADMEIEEVRETFANFKRNQEVVLTEHKIPENRDLSRYSKVVKEPAPKDDPSPSDKPCLISMEEYVEDDEYDKETVIFYSEDGVLTDQFDHVLGVNDIIGEEALKHFGDEEEDIVYVRNNKFMTDYEVVLEHKSSPPTALAEGDEDDDD